MKVWGLVRGRSSSRRRSSWRSGSQLRHLYLGIEGLLVAPRSVTRCHSYDFYTESVSLCRSGDLSEARLHFKEGM